MLTSVASAVDSRCGGAGAAASLLLVPVLFNVVVVIVAAVAVVVNVVAVVVFAIADGGVPVVGTVGTVTSPILFALVATHLSGAFG